MIRITDQAVKEGYTKTLSISGTDPSADVLANPGANELIVITHASIYVQTVGSMGTTAFRLNGVAYWDRVTLSATQSLVLDHDVVVADGNYFGVALFGANATTDVRISATGWLYRY